MIKFFTLIVLCALFLSPVFAAEPLTQLTPKEFLKEAATYSKLSRESSAKFFTIVGGTTLAGSLLMDRKASAYAMGTICLGIAALEWAFPSEIETKYAELAQDPAKSPLEILNANIDRQNVEKMREK